MNTTFNLSGRGLTELVLGVLALVLVILVITDRKPSFLSTDRAAFFALVVIGLGMCTLGGIGDSVEKYGWSAPVNIFGIVLGVFMLLLALAFLFNISVPAITTERIAFFVVAGLSLVKVVLALLPWSQTVT